METQVNSVVCNHCGAPLDIGPDTRFLTCAHCGSGLEVHRTGDALYTQVLESIDQRTQRIEQDVDAIKQQNDVERLDREWALQRDGYMVRGKNGCVSEPSIMAAVCTGVVGVGGGIVFAAFSAANGAPALFPLFGVFFAILGLVMSISIFMKSANYRDAQEKYEGERARVLAQQQYPPSDQV